MNRSTKLRLFVSRTLGPWVGFTVLLSIGIATQVNFSVWIGLLIAGVVAIPAYFIQKMAEDHQLAKEKGLVDTWLAGASSAEDKQARLDLFNREGFNIFSRESVQQQVAAVGSTASLLGDGSTFNHSNTVTHSPIQESYGNTRPTGFQDPTTFMDVNSINSLGSNVYGTGPAHSSLD